MDKYFRLIKTRNETQVKNNSKYYLIDKRDSSIKEVNGRFVKNWLNEENCSEILDGRNEVLNFTWAYDSFYSISNNLIMCRKNSNIAVWCGSRYLMSEVDFFVSVDYISPERINIAHGLYIETMRQGFCGYDDFLRMLL